VNGSELAISFNKGFLLGFAYNKLEWEDDKEVDHVYQVALGIVIFTYTVTVPAE
jgi:hypothetical protein